MARPRQRPPVRPCRKRAPGPGPGARFRHKAV